MQLNRFKQWLDSNFHGLTVERVIGEIELVTADLAALPEATTVADDDLILVQVGSTYKAITFANLVLAITAAQGA